MLTVLLILGVLHAIFIACETALLMLSEGRIERIAEAQPRDTSRLEELVEVRHRMRGMIIFMSALVAMSFALGSVFIASLQSFAPFDVFYLNSALLAFIGLVLYFVLFQAVPRALAVTNPEYIILNTSALTLAFTRVFSWLVTLLSFPAKVLVDAAGGERKLTIWAVSPSWRDDEDEGDTPSAEEQEALREAVGDLEGKIAREVMTPRTDMYALEDTESILSAVNLIGEKGVSRIPIFHENIDDIRGILYSKDLLRYVAHESDWQHNARKNALLNIARPAAFVPETKPVLDLMVEMRKHTHMVIVTDEYGGTSGLVTLEDLLEEIVGDISDEFDTTEIMVTPLGPERYVLDGRTSVSELNDLYDTDFDLDADSVGGLFIELIGHIPEVGETIEAEGIKLIVTRVDGNRILELRACPASNV